MTQQNNKERKLWTLRFTVSRYGDDFIWDLNYLHYIITYLLGTELIYPYGIQFVTDILYLAELSPKFYFRKKK